MTPPERRAMVHTMQAHHELSLGTTCRYLGIHRALVRYASRRPPPTALLARLRVLAEQRPRWGAPRLTWLLRREGWVVNLSAHPSRRPLEARLRRCG